MPEAAAASDLPKVAFVLVAYRQEAFIREAVLAAFAQTYSPLTIILSDDASPDGTFAAMEELARGYQGPHEVICRRNSRNLGLIEHINRLNAEVDAELIVIAAGDDVSLPTRVARNVDAYLKSGRRAHYIYSLVRSMSFEGELGGSYQSPASGDRFDKWKAGLSPFPISIGAAQAWTKALVDRFSPMAPYVWAEDQVFGFRGVLTGPVAFIDEPLVNYRAGSGLTNHNRAFRWKRYLKSQWNGINIYRQRARDAASVGEWPLAFVIAAKFAALTLLFPLSPLFSLLRRRQRTRRRGG